MWLSHDATLLRYELVIADDQELPEAVLEKRVADRLTGSFKCAVDNLIGCGLAARLAASNTSRSFYIRALEADQLLEVLPETFKKLKANSLEAARAKSCQLVAKTVDRRNFSSDYQAVVRGTKPRRDPLQQFAATLSRRNAADFFNGVSMCDEKQIADLKQRAARALATRRRN